MKKSVVVNMQNDLEARPIALLVQEVVIDAEGEDEEAAAAAIEEFLTK